MEPNTIPPEENKANPETPTPINTPPTNAPMAKTSTHTFPQKRHADSNASPIRTYSTDLASAVRKDEMAVIKAALGEDKRRREEEMQFSASSPKNRMFIVLGLLLIFVTVAGVGTAFVIKQNRKPETIPSQTRIDSLITAENTTSIEVGGVSQDKMIELTRTAVNNISSAEGKIMNIYFTDSTSGEKSVITTDQFLYGIKSEVPTELLSTLEKNFMLGMYTESAVRHPFLILRTTDFQVAFASMYDWERKIFSDFYLPFNLTGEENNFTNKFSDLLVENKATRVLRKDNGSVGMIYGFVDDKSLIISDSVESFKEVLHRLQNIR